MKIAIFLLGMIVSSMAFAGAKGSCSIYPNNSFERSESFELEINGPAQTIKVNDQVSLDVSLDTGCSMECWSTLSLKAKVGESSFSISGESEDLQTMRIQHKDKDITIQCIMLH